MTSKKTEIDVCSWRLPSEAGLSKEVRKEGRKEVGFMYINVSSVFHNGTLIMAYELV